jgi:penicillin-binding protein 1A
MFIPRLARSASSTYNKISSTLLLQRKWFSRAIKTILFFSVFILVIVPLYVFAVKENPYNLFGPLPSLRAIENPELDLSSEVISADGVSLGRYYRENRSLVSYDELPEQLVKTLIISEDHRFFDHSGIDFWSYLRVLKGIITSSSQGGGSTLTQQTAKNLFGTRSSELRGKLGEISGPLDMLISKTKEWIIAVQLEETFTKGEIIAIYLNTVPFNYEAFGIKVAALTYFNKTLDSLNIQESSLLVGMLQGTYRFNPIIFPERALSKRNEVVDKLYRHGYLKSLHERDSIKAIPIKLNFTPQSHNEGSARHFINNILRKEMLRWCEEHGYDLFESGLKIHVTLDSRLQRYGEEAMASHMNKMQNDFDIAWRNKDPWVDGNGKQIVGFTDRKIKRSDAYKDLVTKYGEGSELVKQKLSEKKRMKVFTWKGERDTIFSLVDSLRYYNRFLQAGMMAMNPETGEVKAWVGGINYKYFQFDHVQQGQRQGGSTFKPFVFGTAIENGYSPCYKLPNIAPSIPWENGVYCPKNFDGTYGDSVQYTLRQAMARSLNSVTIQLVDKLRPENVTEFARRLGITSKLDPVPSVGLGTSDVSLYEMTAAYSSFVNHGAYILPYYISRIEDKHGNVVQTFVPSQKIVLHESTAYTMVHMLKGGVEEAGGTSRGLSKELLTGNEVGGKTGTTDDGSDGWYIGITHNLVTGIWVGGDDPRIHLPTQLASGSKSALPIWDKFMTKVYRHPETGYTKGSFKKPELQVTLECENYESDSTFLLRDWGLGEVR